MGEGTQARGPGVVMVVGGAALALFTFVSWYDSAGVGLTAWEALRRTDVLIFGAGVVIALAGAWLGFGDPGPEQRVVAAIAAAAGAAAALVVLVRIVSPPGDLEVKLGIFLALAASVVGAVGSLMAFAAPSPPGPGSAGGD